MKGFQGCESGRKVEQQDDDQPGVHLLLDDGRLVCYPLSRGHHVVAHKQVQGILQEI